MSKLGQMRPMVIKSAMSTMQAKRPVSSA